RLRRPRREQRLRARGHRAHERRAHPRQGRESGAAPQGQEGGRDSGGRAPRRGRRFAGARPPRDGRVQEGDDARPVRAGAQEGVRAGGRPLDLARHKITVTVNGAPREAEVDSRLLLVHLIREDFRMTGTHIGCDTTHCGACTVLLDGKPVKSCTLLAVQADGREGMTVEGLEKDGKLDPIQEGFWQEHGLQCGYCTPGMMLTGYALLKARKSPSEGEIREAISGNLCRCTGYVNIVKAVQYAAAKQ